VRFDRRVSELGDYYLMAVNSYPTKPTGSRVLASTNEVKAGPCRGGECSMNSNLAGPTVTVSGFAAFDVLKQHYAAIAAPCLSC